MIIVEGPDCVGKTTLAKKLVREVSKLCGGKPMSYAALSGPHPPEWDFEKSYKERCQSWAIWDRFHLSERAYASYHPDGSATMSDRQLNL